MWQDEEWEMGGDSAEIAMDSQLSPATSDIVLLCGCVVLVEGRSRGFYFGKMPQVS